MRLKQARVRNYRSVLDTDWFNVEDSKTILVGPNEAGKSAVLQALRRLNPAEPLPLDALRDMPRSLLNKTRTGELDVSDVEVVSGDFVASATEAKHLGEDWPRLGDVGGLRRTVYMDNSHRTRLLGGNEAALLGDLFDTIKRLAAHADTQRTDEATPKASDQASEFVRERTGNAKQRLDVLPNTTKALVALLDAWLPLIDEDAEKEMQRLQTLRDAVGLVSDQQQALKWMDGLLPKFVYYSNYYRVRPKIHLQRLATRVSQDLLEDANYDHGNLCLMSLLGIDIDEMAAKGRQETQGAVDSPEQVDEFARAAEERIHTLNAASLDLTEQIQRLWGSDELELTIKADGQFLTVLVRDELGAEIELDQRSEGFQWCTSFWIVFAAETKGDLKNAILLLDEPGVSLHGLKQTGFRDTLSRLAEDNQLLFTTHSPFMVGPDELRLVRVVELPDRRKGTQVHNEPAANQGEALLPLQEALGYDLANTLFTSQRNFVVEGITDYWYVTALNELAAEAGKPALDERIVVHFAGGAGRVAYYATILHASGLKVVALLDSDAAGNSAVKQEGLINLGNKNVLRTADYYDGPVATPETEDLFRATLVELAKELGWEATADAKEQKTRPVVDVLDDVAADFSKARLAKRFVQWSSSHKYEDLPAGERKAWESLVTVVSRRLK